MTDGWARIANDVSTRLRQEAFDALKELEASPLPDRKQGAIWDTRGMARDCTRDHYNRQITKHNRDMFPWMKARI